MREIKFRVWCKKHKYIYDACSLKFIGNKVSANDNSSCIGEEVLMQYTGLKDKNGKEIYEGDIIKAYDHVIAVVEYGKQGEKFVEASFYASYGNRGQSICQMELIEVLGNIYENPELLEE